eukprot:2828888-Pyramimonas_sp.AAC.1
MGPMRLTTTRCDAFVASAASRGPRGAEADEWHGKDMESEDEDLQILLGQPGRGSSVGHQVEEKVRSRRRLPVRGGKTVLAVDPTSR